MEKAQLKSFNTIFSLIEKDCKSKITLGEIIIKHTYDSLCVLNGKSKKLCIESDGTVELHYLADDKDSVVGNVSKAQKLVDRFLNK
jgi:hypothetical protein